MVTGALTWVGAGEPKETQISSRLTKPQNVGRSGVFEFLGHLERFQRYPFKIVASAFLRTSEDFPQARLNQDSAAR
jgi:hypothetical protein